MTFPTDIVSPKTWSVLTIVALFSAILLVGIAVAGLTH